MSVEALRKVIHREGVDRLIIVLMQLVTGKTIKEVNCNQRAIFKEFIVKPLGLETANTMIAEKLDEVVPKMLTKLRKIAVRTEFSLLSKELLTQRINFIGEKWLEKKLKETIEEFIEESKLRLSSPHFSSG